MNGVGPGWLPKHTAELSDAHVTSNLVKRVWGRCSHSAQRASPPPRLLLVVLLSAQILFLAIVRLGPAAPIWSSGNPGQTPSSSSLTVPVLVGHDGRAPALNSEASPHTESKELASSSSPAPSSSSWLSSSPSVLSSDTVNDDDQGLNLDLSIVSEGSNIRELSLEADHQASPPKKKGKAKKRKKTKKETATAVRNEDKHVGGDVKVTGDQSQGGSDNGPSSDEQKVNGDGFHDQKVQDFLSSSQSSDDLLPSISDDLLTEPVKVEEKDRQAMAVVQGEPAGDGEDPVPTLATVTDESKKEDALVAESGWEAAHAEAEVHSTQPAAEEGQQRADEAQSKSMAAEEREFAVAEGADARPEEILPKEDEEAPAQKTEGIVSTISSESEAKHQALVKEEEPLIEQKVEEESGECKYGYIYVYDLPPMFNRDIVANCSALNPWVDVCPTLLNGGLGDSLGDASPLNQTGSWFVSDQFTAEVVFHNRLLQHPCLTDKPEIASGFYVPYYAGLDVGRYLWREFPAERRDWVSNQLLHWLGEQEAWKRRGGWDHFLMIGRITWDFRRSRDEDWGSGFFHHPSMQNTTRLLIERNPWDDKEMAVPYPTNFHPQSEADLREWQNYIRSFSRSKLFSFAGARRNSFPNDFRGILLDQCEQARSCGALHCSNHECENNQKTLELFMDSAFCLQPRGDSFTRRSTFDCMLAGAIPVFFWHRSAYMQYKWHLPDDAESYSVFIPRDEVRNGTKVEDVLSALSPETVQVMRETVIRLVPRIIYAASGFSLKEERDAFDVATEGVMRRFKKLGLGTQG